MAIELPGGEATIDNFFIEKATKHSETFSYGTARISPPFPPGVGAMPAFVSDQDLKVGFYYTVKGTWQEFNSKPQLKVTEIIEERAPRSSDGLKKFFTGYESIGPIKAGKIVDALGDNAFEKIIADYKILLPWLREEVALSIKEDLVGDPERQALKRDLMAIGVGNSLINKIFDYLGSNAIKAVKEKPYDLIHIEGIGFKTCDSIAIKIGKVDLNDPERLKRIAIYIAEELIERESGDTLFTLDDIRLSCKKALKNINAFDGGLLMYRVDQMVDEGAFKLIEIAKKQYLQTEKSYWDEKSIASRVASVIGTVKKKITGIAVAEQIEGVEPAAAYETNEIEKVDLDCIQNRLTMMSADQLAAVEGLITQRICVLTGGPGTGKSFVVNSVKTAFKLNGKSVAVVAPTGKAAALVGGTTIHRKLGWGMNGNWGPNTEITDDVLIVDETSMVENDLMLALLNMTNKDTRIVFVGDPDQLPPIGKGFPFKQMILCGKVPVYSLTTIHRTQDGSMIPHLAQQIKNGEKIDISHDSVVIITDKAMERKKTEIKEDGDDKLEAAPLEVLTEKLVNTYISMMLSAKQQGESIGVQDIMILVPYSSSKMKPNTAEINSRIQEFRFKKSPDRFIFEKGTKRLAIGDRVIRTKNRLIEVEDLEGNLFNVFNSNGDCGIITGKGEGGGILVRYDRDDIPKEVLVPSDQISEIQLAYALTNHKCVDPETIVETKFGLMRIKNIPMNGEIGTKFGFRQYGNYVYNSNGLMFEIETENGYKIKVTPDHKLNVWSNDNYSEKQAANLIVGDYLRLLMRSTGEQFSSLLPNSKIGDVRENTYRFPARMTPDLAEFIGLIVADGSIEKNQFIQLKKRHKEVIERFCALSYFVFGKKISFKQKNNTWEANLCSTQICKWLSDIGGMDPCDKHIPNAVLESSQECHIAFLRGLFEDGTVNIKNGKFDHIEFTTTVESIHDVVKIMLLRMGIITSSDVRVHSSINKNNTYVLYVYKEYAKKFKEKIGFISKFKQSRLEDIDDNQICRFTIPISSWIIDELKLRNKTIKSLTKSDVDNAGFSKKISKRVARKVIESFPPSSLAARWLANESQFHHDKIKSIRLTSGPSICVEVFGVGEFIQNGFDGKNSQGSQSRFVLVAAHSSNGYLVDRSAFYTAVTRARELVVIVTPNIDDAHSLYKKKSPERKSLVGFRIKTWKKSMDGASFIGLSKKAENPFADAGEKLKHMIDTDDQIPQVDTQGPRKLNV